MSKQPILTIDGQSRPILHSELSLRVETETWDEASNQWVYGRNPSLTLALEVVVDENSGQDGALAPSAYVSLPSDMPAKLQGVVFEESRHKFEAWWGNDAPKLGENQLGLKSELTSGLVEVRWTATSEKGTALALEGPVEFVGLSLKVKRVSDAESYLRKAWPALDGSRLELVSESELEFGDDEEDNEVEEDRQHWMELHYNIKG